MTFDSNLLDRCTSPFEDETLCDSVMFVASIGIHRCTCSKSLRELVGQSGASSLRFLWLIDFW